jgi:hypothetical protein
MANKAQEWLRPAGWQVESTLWVPTGPAPFYTTNSPIATILTKGKQMTILIRGTQTIADMLTGEAHSVGAVLCVQRLQTLRVLLLKPARCRCISHIIV